MNIGSSLIGAAKMLLGGVALIVLHALAAILSIAAIFLLGFFVCCKVTPKSSVEKLQSLKIKFKWYDLIRWVLIDIKNRKERKNVFPFFGFSIFVGKQGAGKTMSLVQYLVTQKEKYPDCIVVTNFKCSAADKIMNDWRDFFNIRNGDKGVIFAIDEIHSEYDSKSWRDFPESLLSEISQQRKQRVKIVATSQAYKRIAKPMREQTFSVIECRTYLKRLTCCKEYDAFEYECLDSMYNNGKIKAFNSYSFVQSDSLRNSYDTYEKIKKLQKSEFIPRQERVSQTDISM